MKSILFRLVARGAVLAAAFLAVVQLASAVRLAKTNLPAATVGGPYSFALTASGGTPPYTFSFLSGGFPAGRGGGGEEAAGAVALNPSESPGMITGAPTVMGAWAYEYPYLMYIQVTDSIGATAAIDLPMNLLGP